MKVNSMNRMIEIYGLLFLIFCAWMTGAEEPNYPVLLDSEVSNHLSTALSQREMTWNDLRFDKDVAKSRCGMSLSRDILNDPLQLPLLADEVVGNLASSSTTNLWPFIDFVYGVPDQQYDELKFEKDFSLPDELDDVLRTALNDFLNRVDYINLLVKKAFEKITTEEREYAVATVLSAVFDAEDHPEIQQAMMDAGIATAIIQRVSIETSDIDPRLYATNQLQVVYAIDYPILFQAARQLATAVDLLKKGIADVQHWPVSPVSFQSPFGLTHIGTTGNDRFSGAAALIVDPGGNDFYENTASANGLSGLAVSVVLDLAGDDFYDSNGLLGAGTALWGLCLMEDLDGRDIYRSRYTGQGAGLFGVASLTDRAGQDQYIAGSLAQAAAYAGVGLLVDDEGNDTRTLNSAGQAYASVMGLALLIDYDGNDVYSAGRVYQDYERHWQQYVSISQGFATGMRPFAGGGLAVLLDVTGNDSYLADVYGQGVGYWYAIGMLLDLQGHDTYKIHEYGQGSGIHLSSGLLADYKGNDFYTGFSLAQGSAHDYAVGMLFDLQGDDTYTADHHAQGRGINNALGLLIDTRGRDAYFARDTAQSQGAGHFASLREYGSLSLLFDLANEDQYSSGATNGTTTFRPEYGLIYDVATNQPRPSFVPVDTLPPPDFSLLSLDELMTNACRYGDTEERRVHKKTAVDEFINRGSEALSYLLEHSDTENMWNMVYADQIVRAMPAQEVASNLMVIIETPETLDLTRKYALFFLGYHSTPQYTDRILPWLSNDLTAGATIRTLGKWQATNALPYITSFLQSTNERKRILAVNAFHDIQHPGSEKQLIPLLEDPLFTVRFNTRRAITNIPSL